MNEPSPAGAAGPTPSAYARMFAVFTEARELRGEARDAFLARACEGDPGLRDEVAALLALDVPDDAPTVDRAATAVAAAAVRALDAAAGSAPERIGRYRIVRRVAEGGMGVVYEAVQDTPARTVALKVVRSAVATPATLRRLELEAETLAQFSHPGLAQIYEAGSIEGPFGRQPWFAMEFVRGTRLDAWARQAAPTSRARLALAAEVAEAVHHAHQRGVVHRDLKPANILVQEDGRPKVLDFGVARVTAVGDGRAATVATQLGQVLGTLPYMSPEQLAGRASDVDVRTDVYALGVVLYELLTGRLPIEVDTDSLASAARRVSEEVPPALGLLDARYRGDVETIVAKALAKDREDRYPSAQAFADDLRRFLADEPIQARPPSAMYVLRKFTRRHRALAVVGVLLLLTLTAAAVGGTWLASAEREARALADARASEAARERDASRRFAYTSAIASAQGALDVPDVARAAADLERAPSEHRAWEWAYLRARLDDAMDVMPAEPDAPAEDVRDLGGGRLRLLQRRRADADAVSVVDRTIPSVAAEPPVPVSVPGLRAVSADGRTWVRAVAGRLELVRDGAGVLRSVPAPGAWIVSVTDAGDGLWWVTRDGPYLLHLAGATPPARTADDGVLVWEVTPRHYASGGARDLRGPVVLGGDSGTVVVCAIGPDGRAVPARAHDLHVSPCASCDVDADARRIVTCATDSSLVVSSVADGAVLLRVPGRREETRGARFSPDGRRLVTWGEDGGIRLRDAASGAVDATFVGARGLPSGARFGADGATVVAADAEGTVRRFDATATDAGDFVCRGHGTYVYDVRVSPRGELVASVAWDGTLRVWDARTLREVARRSEGPPLPAFAVAWSPDGTKLASTMVSQAAGGTVLRVDDLARGTSVELLRDATQVRGLAFTATGLLLCSTGDGIAVFDATTLAPAGRIGGGPVNALAVTPDGRRVACVTRDLEVWDLATRTRVRSLPAPTLPVGQLAFHPDGRRLAAATHDGTLRLYDVEGVRDPAVLTWHRGRVLSVAFSPDGARLFTGGDDARLAVWDTERLGVVFATPAHRWYVHAIDVAPDGSTVYTGSGDGDVRVWAARSRGDLHRARRASPEAAVRTLPAVLVAGR